MTVQPEEPTEIPNWRRLSARVTTSGQPSEAQFAQIKDLGVEEVINLAPHSVPRAIPDEAATLAELGLGYTYIPVDFANPTEADFAAFSDAMHAIGDRAVHVHCIVNARVSAFIYRYQREKLGMPELHARAHMEAIWRPGGVWAEFIGDTQRVSAEHEYAKFQY